MRKSKIDHRSSTEFSIGVPVRDQLVAGADGFDGLGILCLAVLDVLGFIQHDGVEVQAPVMAASRRSSA